MDRRKHSPEIEQANQDRLTKRVIVYSACAIGVMAMIAEILLPCFGKTPTQTVDIIASSSFTGLLGMGFKTGVDVTTKPAAIGEAVVAASEQRPIQTENAGDNP